MKAHTFIAVLTVSIALQAKPVVQILPAGEFKARDGRPGPGKSWKLSDADGVKLAAEMTAAFQSNAFVFDYEHQTMHSSENGKPAPAAAWATTFEWQPGKGLFATDVKWTESARTAVEADEYRYLSPVIVFDKTGRVLTVLHAAITNTPALVGMDPLAAPSSPAAASLMASLAAQFDDDQPPELSMTLQALLIAALGLKTDTTETDLVQTVIQFKSRAEAPQLIPAALATALAVKPDGDVTIAVTAIEELKSKAGSTDATATTTIAALQQEIAVLKKTKSGDEVTALVEANVGKKLLPALKQWAIDLGNRDIAELRKFIDASPDLNLSTTQTGGQAPSGSKGDGKELSQAEKDICAQLNISAEEYAKTRAAQAA